MLKKVFVIRGASNTGKTTTIKMVYELLKEKYPEAKIIIEVKKTKDICVVIMINDVKIGIESQGDPNSRLFESLPEFIKLGCNIILCAARTRGKTIETVELLSKNNGFSIELIQSNVEQDNSKRARAIFDSIVSIIEAL